MKTGSKSLQKPPHLPLILGSNQAETNSHKNLVKSLTSGRGGGGILMKGRWLYAQNYLFENSGTVPANIREILGDCPRVS